MLVKRIARIRRHKCQTFANRESEKPLNGFLSFNQSIKKGKSPLTVGFIISVTDPLSKIWMNFGDGKKEVPNTKGLLRIFNHTYYKNKEFKGCVTIRDSNSDWKIHTFSIISEKDYTQRGGLITKFYQTKGAGTAHGTGTDVAFMISTGRTLKKTIWNFDIKKPPHRQTKLEMSTNHQYRRTGKYKGSITVEDYEDKREIHIFDVIVK